MSKTLIDSGTLSRLVAVAATLSKMSENLWVRDTGESLFRDARNELDDVIRTAVEPITAAPVTVVQAVPVDQVEALVDAAVQRVEAGKAAMVETVATELQGIHKVAAEAVESLAAAIRGDLEGSDVAVLDAIASTRADLLAAVAPATE